MTVEQFICISGFKLAGQFIKGDNNQVVISDEVNSLLEKDNITYLWVTPDPDNVVVYVGETMRNFNDRNHTKCFNEKCLNEKGELTRKYRIGLSLIKKHTYLKIYIRKAKLITLFTKEVYLTKTEEDALISVFNYKNLRDKGFLECNKIGKKRLNDECSMQFLL